MGLRYLLYVIVPVLMACSSTLHYQATGYYSVSPDNGDVTHFEDGSTCTSAAAGQCTRIRLQWETERYCGIYGKAPDHVTDRQLRVGSSPTTITHWVVFDDRTVLLGDDEQFEVVIGDDVLIESDLLCGQFQPPVKLVAVHEGDTLSLEIYCRTVLNGIKLMPPSETPYRLQVNVVEKEKSIFGCKN